MKTVKLHTVALSVYQKCFAYYKNVSETTIVTEIEEQITTTSMEIIKSSTTTVSESTEITIREVCVASFQRRQTIFSLFHHHLEGPDANKR
jgi:hypothetical protein